MAKKPSEKTPKIPTASKKTRDAIAFFNDKKPAHELMEVPDGRTTRKFEHSGYAKTLNDKFFDAIEGKGKYVALAITTAVVSYAIYWMMNQ